jgi:hypothetical protein
MISCPSCVMQLLIVNHCQQPCVYSININIEALIAKNRALARTTLRYPCMSKNSTVDPPAIVDPQQPWRQAPSIVLLLMPA